MHRLLSRRVETRGWGPATLLALLVCGLHTPPAAAQTTYYWAPTGTFNSGGAGTWSTANAWRTDTSTGSLATYANGSDTTAIIGGTSNAAYTITLTGSLQVNTIRLDASTGAGKTVTIENANQPLVFAGSNPSVYGTPGRTLQIATANTGTYSLAAGATLTFDGGGTVTMLGRLRPAGTNTTVIVSNTTFVNFQNTSGGYIDGSGTAPRPATVVVNSGTLRFLNGIFTSPITLGTNGAGGGTLQLTANTISSDMRSTLSVGGTSKSIINQSVGTYAFLSGSSPSSTFPVTVNSTSDASNIDLEYSVGWRRGIFEKLGLGTVRLAVTGTFNNPADFTTYLNTGTTLRVTEGKFLNEGTVKSVANVAGGVLTTTSTAGTFDQVNVTSGTFEIARSSGLFATLAGGTTYAAGNNALNLRGGTLRYVGVTTDYSASMGTLGGVASTIDTNGQSVSFATGLTGTGGLTKAGAGVLALNGTSSYTGLTSVSAGDLRINGAVTGNVSVATGAALGGSGRFAGLSGAGLIAPGNSPGILTGTGSVDPTGGLDFALEITGTAPLWSNPTASVNDVLRITNPTPFTAPLASGVNTVSVYLDVATLGSGDEFLGGFFTDRTTGLAADVTSATYEFYVSGTGGGGVPYNGTSYFTLADWIASPQNTGGVTGIDVSVRTVPTANFTGGDATGGQSTLFVVVPEPATVAAGLVGLAAAAWAARRRRAVRYDPEG